MKTQRGRVRSRIAGLALLSLLWGGLQGCSTAPLPQQVANRYCAKIYQGFYNSLSDNKALVAGLNEYGAVCFMESRKNNIQDAEGQALARCHLSYQECFVYAENEGLSDWARSEIEGGSPSGVVVPGPVASTPVATSQQEASTASDTSVTASAPLSANDAGPVNETTNASGDVPMASPSEGSSASSIAATSEASDSEKPAIGEPSSGGGNSWHLPSLSTILTYGSAALEAAPAVTGLVRGSGVGSSYGGVSSSSAICRQLLSMAQQCRTNQINMNSLGSTGLGTTGQAGSFNDCYNNYMGGYRADGCR